MFKEFKEFALKGNMLDMAVGIIIGGAFGKIISSFVGDILMPPLGLLFGRVDLTKVFIALDGGSYATLDAARAAGAITVNVGAFLNTVIDFLLVALAIFLAVRQINRLKKAEAPAAPTTRDCPLCLSAIPLAARRCPHCTSEISPA